MSLSRRGLIGGAMALSLALPARAQMRTHDLAPREVAQGVWMIEGAREVFTRANAGAIVNIALLETASGAVVIDTGSTAAMGAGIRAFADQRLGGVAAVINTHHHPDHWFGNAAFADRPVMALPATIATCRTHAQDYAEALYAILGSAMAGTDPLPATRELAGGRIEPGGRGLQLMPMAGHCSADLVVLDEPTGTLIAGDLLFLDRAPSLPDADVALWLTALDRIATLAVSGTLPGHGGFHRSSAALVQTRQYLEATRARLDLAAGLGLTPVEAMAAGPVPEFAALGANPEEYLRSVVRRWSDHEIDALPVIAGI